MDALPVAVSNAVVTGSAAVLGALVGAAAGGLVDAWLSGRGERARARTGARLVASDLDKSANLLAVMASDRNWYHEQELAVGAWPEYRDVLAVRLEDRFEAVSNAVVGLAVLTSARGRTEQPAPNDRDVGGFDELRAMATEAYNGLADLGQLPEVTGLLGEEGPR
jgi:hypothetical protein